MTRNVRNVKVQLWNKPALLSSEGEQLVKFDFQNCDSLEMLEPSLCRQATEQRYHVAEAVVPANTYSCL